MRRPFIVLLAALFTVSLHATESNPSKRQRQLIDKLLELTDVDNMIRVAMDSMFGEIERQLVQQAEADGEESDSIAEAIELSAAFRQRSAKVDFAGLMEEGACPPARQHAARRRTARAEDRRDHG